MSEPYDLSQPAFDLPPRAAAAGAPYLEVLNEAQREAVEATEGPVLVLAGAGTGKTRVLTTRLAHILNQRLAWPGQILAVTFTNKASREMAERTAALIGEAVEGLWIGTFHAMAARILRRHAELVGRKSNFTILDTDDQVRLLKQVLSAANIDEKRWPARSLAAIISGWKDQGLTPDKVPAAGAGEFASGRAVALYTAYQERLRALNAADFGDLVLLCLEVFLRHEDVLVDYHRRFRYILVDEYQDTNVSQYLWLRLLARGHRNLCCVGDDDQSIYGWRGADVGNILRFEEDFPGARVVRLERNYRSTPHILGCAAALIANNKSRLGKTLWTALEEGEKVRVRGVWDSQEEARLIAEDIEAGLHHGRTLGETAILVRTSSQTREFEERFIQTGLAYRVVGGLRFYERREIRDALAYLRVIAQPDDDLGFERILNVPKRGIGEATVQALHTLARARGIPLTRAAEALIETDELRGPARHSLARLLANFERWRGLVQQLDHAELVETVLDESGYTEMWQNDRSADAPGRLDNLMELVRAIEEFENLTGFLEHVSLVMENDQVTDGEQVSLITLHGAKGLEFDTVFLPGWEEGLFPHQRALDEGGFAGLEEERRLAHVGLTRARKHVMITFAASRRQFGEMSHGNLPSRFIDELPEAHVERVAEAGLNERPGAAWGWDGYGAAREGAMADPVRDRPNLGRRNSRYRNVTSGGLIIEGRSEAVERGSGDAAYAPGQRIFHQKFGYGRIRAADGERLEIDFDKAGVKKVIAAFVEPA